MFDWHTEVCLLALRGGIAVEKCLKLVIISRENKRTSPDSVALAKSDCLGVLPVSKEHWSGSENPWNTYDASSWRWGQRGAGRECPGSLTETCRITYPDSQHRSQIPGLEVASGARNLAHHCKARMTCSIPGPQQGESWRPFSKRFSHLHVGHSNTDEAWCVCLLLELPAIAWPLSADICGTWP